MAPGRTLAYAMWRCCERWGLLPSGIKTNFQDNSTWGAATLLAYEQIRQTEEVELAMGSTFAKKGI